MLIKFRGIFQTHPFNLVSPYPHLGYTVMQSKLFDITKYKSGFVNALYLSPFILMLIPFRRQIKSLLILGINLDDNMLIMICITSLVLLIVIFGAIRQWYDCAKYNGLNFSFRFLIMNSTITACLTLAGVYMSWCYVEWALESAAALATAILVSINITGFGGLQPLGGSPVNIVKPSNKYTLPNKFLMESDAGNANKGWEPQSSVGNIGSSNSVDSNIRVSYTLGDKPTQIVEVPNNAVLFPTNNTEETALNSLNNERNAYDIIAAKSLSDVMNHLVERNKVPKQETKIFNLIPRIYKLSVDTIDSTLNKYPEGSKEWRLARLQLQTNRSQELSRLKDKLISECELVLSKNYPGFNKDPAIVSYSHSLNNLNKEKFEKDRRCNNMTSEIINKIKSDNK